MKAENKKVQVMTMDRFVIEFDNIKELIKTTAKATAHSVETSLKKEIDTLKFRLEITQSAVLDNSAMIKELKTEVKRVDGKVDGVKTDLIGKIDIVRTELKEEMHKMEERLCELEERLCELKEETHKMEGRLSEKIDRSGARIANHEARIAALETGI